MTLYLQTLGCRLNQAEEARFAADFLAAGFTLVDNPAVADLCLIHSCTITRQAERHSLRLVTAFKESRAPAPPLVVFTGCAVTTSSTGRLAAAGVDLIVPRHELEQLLPRVIELTGGEPGADVAARAAAAPPRFRTRRALLRLQDGCDFNCAYCIVPHTRGAPVSRPFREVEREALALLAQGHRELVLTGCNLATYRDAGRDLPAAAAALARLAREHQARIRLGSVEPATVERELAELMRVTPNLCRSLHLPLQSGADATLQQMGRRYGAAEVVETLSYIRQLLPDLALGSDLITGFPGEDEADFAATVALLERFEFAKLHIFPYSPRPGTRAATLPGRPPVQVARERARELRHIGGAMRQRYAARWQGRQVEVLLENSTSDGIRHGWSDTYLPCRLHDPVTPDGHLTTFVPDTVCGDLLTQSGISPANP